jgi:hypothetical protein
MKGDRDRIQDIEAILAAKGVTKENYDEIQQLLSERKNVEKNIEDEHGEQYYEDAFKATAGMGLTRAMIVQVARYLSDFAARAVRDAKDSN